jgi:NodT family efflux transporter outer membrane factor (OMF) lipoprotein
MRCIRAAPVLLAATALGACRLGPDFKAPQTSLPPAWDHAQAGAPASWPSPEWWTEFGSPQLNELVAAARGGNNDLAAATARVREAEAQTAIAGAPLYPSVQEVATAGPERVMNLVGTERHHVLYQLFTQASYEIDFWGKNRAALDSAKASADGARYARDVVWLTTATGIANLYFQDLALQDRLKVARDNLSRAQRALADITREEHQGIVPHLAVVQQQAAVANLETVTPPLEQQLAAARTGLAILVGKLPEDMRLHDGSLRDVRSPPLVTGAPSELLTRRPDVQQAEASLVAAHADIRVARAQLFPSLALNLSAGPTTLTVDQRTPPVLGAYSLLGSVTQPIFEGGALRGHLDQTKARYQELLAGTYRQAVLTAFGDVELALASVKSANEELAAEQRSVAFAQQSYALTDKSQQGGVATILTLLDAETAEYAAQDALVQAQLAHLQALVGLTKALGGGWKL